MKLLYLHHIPISKNFANVIQVLEMCRAFQKVGVETTLAVPEGGEYSMGDVYNLVDSKMGKKSNFKIVFFPGYAVAGRGRALGAYFAAKSLLRNAKDYDFCYVRNFFLNRLALNYSLKVIFESHNSVLNTKSRLLNRLYRWKFLSDVRSDNQILFVAISRALATVWEEQGVPREKILTLHDGVSAEDYESVVSRRDARKQLGINPEGRLVVYAGSLYKDRCIDSILRLAGKLRNTFFYVIGGSESERKYHEALAVKLGLSNVVFTGRVPHEKVRDYLFAADVLLMLWSWRVPTINYCSPLKMFEYMAAGRIIVGHGFPTVREVLKHEETALLVDPDSFKDLESKLRYALSLDYPNEMAEKARYIVLNNYSWEKRAGSIVEGLHSKL